MVAGREVARDGGALVREREHWQGRGEHRQGSTGKGVGDGRETGEPGKREKFFGGAKILSWLELPGVLNGITISDGNA